MSRRLPLIALLILIALPNSLWSTEPLRIGVLCYNIHHGEGMDGKLDLERIANVIRSVDPDMVALQEVDRRAQRSNSVDQPERLAKLTGMHVAFGANISLQGGHYGNAVLSRFPIDESENHLLPQFGNGEQRGVLSCDITIPDHTISLRFLSTHFDHRRSHRERIASANSLRTRFSNDDRPTILAGDFNCTIGSEAMNVLDSVFQRTNALPLPTIPVSAPSRQIDFILVRPPNRWKAVETKVLPEAVASDHRAIYSLLEYQVDAP